MADVKCHIFNESTDIYLDDTENIIAYDSYIIETRTMEMELMIISKKADEIYKNIKKLIDENFNIILLTELAYENTNISILLNSQITKCGITNHERIDMNIISQSYTDDTINVKDKIMQYVLMDKTLIDTEAMNIVTDKQTIELLNMMK